MKAVNVKCYVMLLAYVGKLMEFRRKLIGKCGIYCGACRLYILNDCKGCYEETKCPYYKCVETKKIGSCGECQEFPCDKHYGQMAVYAKKFLNWKKQEIKKHTS